MKPPKKIKNHTLKRGCSQRPRSSNAARTCGKDTAKSLFQKHALAKVQTTRDQSDHFSQHALPETSAAVFRSYIRLRFYSLENDSNATELLSHTVDLSLNHALVLSCQT
jgi:hypothetical protein